MRKKDLQPYSLFKFVTYVIESGIRQMKKPQNPIPDKSNTR